MISEPLASEVFAKARAGGADFAELYVERNKTRMMRLLSGELKEATSGIRYGAGLRLFYGVDIVYAYTNDLTAESLLEICDTLLKLKGQGSVDEQGRIDDKGRGGLDFRKAVSKGLHAPKIALDAKDKRYRLERLLEAEAGAKVAGEIKQVETFLSEGEKDVLVANSEGVWAEDKRIRTRMGVTAIAQSDNDMQTGKDFPGLSCGLELFDNFPPREVGRKAGEQAMTNLRARLAPAGTMPVVVGNAFGGVLFHEALGHLLETTSVAKRTSVLTDKLGEKIASDCVTYIDEGTTPHGWGSQEFDDEGMKSEHTTLIEKGVLKRYMVDKLGEMKTGYPARTKRT